MRAAAFRAAAAIDPESFTFVLSGMEPDRDWRVRATLAEILGSLKPEVALDRARSMLQDSDKRIIGSVLGALVKLHAPEAADVLAERLKDPDFVVRSAAAEGLGTLKPPNGPAPCARRTRLRSRTPSTWRVPQSCRPWPRTVPRRPRPPSRRR